jgi:hypothetical protein
VGLLIWHPLSQAGHSHAKAREPVLIIIDYQAVDHRRRPRSWKPSSGFTPLRLKLEAQTGPAAVLVIDHVEHPTPNSV